MAKTISPAIYLSKNNKNMEKTQKKNQIRISATSRKTLILF